MSRPDVLIAGIGNIFHGDDAFGVEVVRRLARRALPANVRVADFGIRGYDLGFALLEGYQTTILVDAAPRGGKPGSVYVIEPGLEDGDTAEGGTPEFDGHGMNPMRVLELVRRMGGRLDRIVLVGCEPATLEPGDGEPFGLSPPVEAAVEVAIGIIESLVVGADEVRETVIQEAGDAD